MCNIKIVGSLPKKILCSIESIIKFVMLLIEEFGTALYFMIYQ